MSLLKKVQNHWITILVIAIIFLLWIFNIKVKNPQKPKSIEFKIKGKDSREV